MSSGNPGRSRFGAWWPALLCLVPIATFYALLGAQMRPVPIFDDYHAILQFALDLNNNQGFWHKLAFIAAAQHDEYKLITEHLLVAGDLALSHRVHFAFLITVGNLLALGIGWLFWANSFEGEHDLQERMLLFAPVLWFLFQLNYVENLDWAMCSLQTMPVILFSMASVHFGVRPGLGSTLLAGLCVVLASFSSANGFLAVPILACIFLVARRFQAVLALGCSTLLASAVYLYHYQRFTPPGTAEPTNWTDKLLFFLSFLGASVEDMHHRPVKDASLVLGVLVLGSLLLMCSRWRTRARGSFTLSVAAWCLLSAAAVTHGRSAQGVAMSLTGRYKIYSDLLLISAYLFWTSSPGWSDRRSQSGRIFWAAALGFSVLFAVGGDVAGYRYLVKRRERVALGLRQYLADPAKNPPEVSLGGEPFGGTEPEYARRVLTQVLQAGLYRLPVPRQSASQ